MKYNKKIIICSIFIIISFTLLIVISSKSTKTFNYNGSIIALKVDGSDAASFPSKGKYNVSVNCENGKGVWNPKTWKLEITKIKETVTCDILFNSNASNLSDVVDSKGTSTTHGIRYQGKNPDNYVWYNDELWRIIGNVPVCLTSGCTSTENRVKLIRNYSIGGISFNQTNFSSSSPFTWIGSNVQNLLNTCYLGKTSSCDSYCYSNGTKAAGTCDYSSDGIDTSDYYGNMIENVYYNVGVPSSGSFVNADDQYTKEIASYASSASKIGLMYASDWGYAIEGYTSSLVSSSAASYMNKNWLFSNGHEWTMSAYSYSKNLYVSEFGGLAADSPFSGYAVRPVLYLKSNVYVVSGTGTKVDPYRIGM